MPTCSRVELTGLSISVGAVKVARFDKPVQMHIRRPGGNSLPRRPI